METTRLCLLFMTTCLLGSFYRHVLASDSKAVGSQGESAVSEAAQFASQLRKVPQAPAKGEEGGGKDAEGETPKSDTGAVRETGDLKLQGETSFPLGHRIEVQVHHGVYIVERKLSKPDYLTISLQLLNGEKHVLGFVPMVEVTAMLEEAKNLGSGLPEALLDTSFLSYVFEQEGSPVGPAPTDPLATTTLAKDFLRAEAGADGQAVAAEKKRDEDEEEGEDEDEDEEEGENVEEEDDVVEEQSGQASKQAALRGSKD